MLVPTIPGWKVETVGDDIAWMKFGADGRLYAINPEAGFFGVAPGTSHAVQPQRHGSDRPRHHLHQRGPDRRRGRLVGGDRLRRARARSSTGRATDWDTTDKPTGPAAHPNARFTAPRRQCPSIAPDWEDPAGVPIDAILFGGRRPGTIPLVHQALNWNHGVFMGSIIGSEITAAALDLKAGTVRRDPFAMLPFCGYHMGDYFRHWLGIGQRDDASKLPKLFIVNWFREDADGKWLWPGYGENSRVLAWIFDQCAGVPGQSVETAIGVMPTADAIARPAAVSAADMRELLAVDAAGWRKELADIEANHYPSFKHKLPAELTGGALGPQAPARASPARGGGGDASVSDDQALEECFAANRDWAARMRARIPGSSTGCATNSAPSYCGSDARTAGCPPTASSASNRARSSSTATWPTSSHTPT